MAYHRIVRSFGVLAGVAALALASHAYGQLAPLGAGAPQRPGNPPAAGAQPATIPPVAAIQGAGVPVIVEATALSTSPANPRPGQPTVVKFVIRNAGSTPVARVPWVIHLYSANQTLARGEQTNVLPGASFEVKANWVPPTGTHLLQGYVDPTGQAFPNAAHPSMRVQDMSVNVAHQPFAEAFHFYTQERTPRGACSTSTLGELTVNVPDDGFLVIRGHAALRGVAAAAQCSPPADLAGFGAALAGAVFAPGFQPGRAGKVWLRLVRPDVQDPGSRELSGSTDEFDPDVLGYRRMDVAATLRVQRGVVRLRLEAVNGTGAGFGENNLTAMFLPLRQP